MAVNIYDDVNRLEAAFRQTAEFTAVKDAIAAVQADEEAGLLFKEFREIQMKMQQKQVQGEEIAPEELEEAQSIAQKAQENEKVMAMMQAEMKLSGVLEEINRVLMKPVSELYDQF